MGEVGFAEDLSECGGLLQFYMPVTFDPDAVFGTHVATAENDDWLNVYAAYDLNASRPCSALDVILVCGDGNEFAFRYPLAKQEQAALLEKMDAYCLEQTGMALADFRPGIWWRNRSPARLGAWRGCGSSTRYRARKSASAMPVCSRQ